MGCGAEALTIVSMLSVPSVFFRPPDRAEESGQCDDSQADLYRDQFMHLARGLRVCYPSMEWFYMHGLVPIVQAVAKDSFVTG